MEGSMNEVPDEFVCHIRFSGNTEDVKYGLDEQGDSYISDIEVQVIDGPLAGKRLWLNVAEFSSGKRLGLNVAEFS